MKLPVKFQLILLSVMPLFLSFQSCDHENPEKDEKVIATFQPDPLIGDWSGTTSTGDSIFAQVIGHAGNQYRVHMVTALYANDNILAKLSGEMSEGTVYLESEADGRTWLASLQKGIFTGSYVGEETVSFRLEKTVRISPTLGAVPPEDALVLFDKNSLAMWEHIRDRTGYLNLARIAPDTDCAGYLSTRIWSESEQSAILQAGCDDGIRVWVNGTEVLSDYESGAAEPLEYRTGLTLQQGWNDLLVKIINGDGGWGAFLRLVDTRGGPIEGIAEEDPQAEGDTVTRFLDRNDQYLTLWRFSGPYHRDGLTGGDLLDVAFAPEDSTGAGKNRTFFDFNAIDYTAGWYIRDGAMEVNPGSGSIISKPVFSDITLHIEFRSPYMPVAREQKRGNSGVYLQGRYEVQVLDSYGLAGRDNECGGIYKVSAPRVNMCAPPAQWQTYDIDFTAPRFNDRGDKTADARITVRHNGVIIHENLEIPHPTGGEVNRLIQEPEGIMLQDHGDPVQYRNIWVIENNN